MGVARELAHGDLLADHGGCETERQAKEHLEGFLEAVDRTVSTVNEQPRGDEVIGQQCWPPRPRSRTCE
ncbi:MAG: hypothetical protein K0R61_3252 [Microvirga sp.]|nr:hypothetical protein [Microvirga sp.]